MRLVARTAITVVALAGAERHRLIQPTKQRHHRGCVGKARHSASQARIPGLDLVRQIPGANEAVYKPRPSS